MFNAILASGSTRRYLRFVSNRNRSKLTAYNCFFITTTCNHHLQLLTIGNNMKILCDNVIHYNEKYFVDTLGYVIMPNHFHSIILFKQENRLSDYMRDLKKYTAVEMRVEISVVEPTILTQLEYVNRKQIYKVWNDRFNDKHIYTTEFLQQKLNYIHNNPLQDHWRLATFPEEYRYSSAQFYFCNKAGDIPVTDYRNYFSIPVG